MNSSSYSVTDDIVVIGSGLAGLAAAVAAVEGGASVRVYEISQEVGGLTRLSDGLINAVDPKRQETDSIQQHIHQTLQYGEYRGDEALVSVLCRDAAEALDWLSSVGVTFKDRVRQRPGSLFPRGHLPADGNGKIYTESLLGKAKSLGVKIYLQHELTALRLTGLRPKFELVVLDHSTGRSRCIRTNRCILASGGYSSDTELLQSHDPRLTKSIVMATLPVKAYVHRSAVDAGFAVSGMSFAQKDISLPNGDPLPPIFRNPAAYIALDDRGQRFMREDLRDNAWLEEAINRTSGLVRLVADGRNQPLGAYWTVTENLETLAKDLNISYQVLSRELDRYNKIVQDRRDRFFGKASRALTQSIGGPEYIGAQCQVRVLTTLGGIRISPEAEILNRALIPIRGLFAAGDVTGGIHGKYALTGNLLLSALVFGLRAGRNAAKL